MPSLPITRAELDRILQEYDRPIITGRGVCTFSEYNRLCVQAARQWQPAYWALVTNAARDDMVWEFLHYAEVERGWVFIMRHDDGINFVPMSNEAKREKVSRLLGERPRLRNPAAVAVAPPPQHPLIVDVRLDDTTDRVPTARTHQVASPTQPDVASLRRAPSNASMASSNASWNGNGSLSSLRSEPLVVPPLYDDDDDEDESVVSGSDGSDESSHHSAGHTHPTNPNVASLRRAPSNASMVSSNASWNGILLLLDADAEDFGVEAEVDTVTYTLLTHDTLMEMAMGICSVGSMDSLQLQHAFAATSPVGMEVAFERIMD